MTTSTIRIRGLLMALALVTAACGSDSDGAAKTSVAVQDLVPTEALAVAQTIVTDLGPEPATVAVGYALDRGYTAPQIVAAATTHTLHADGTIDGAAPEHPVWGLFADLPATGPAGLRSGGGDQLAVSAGTGAEQVTKDEFTRGLARNFESYMEGPSAVADGEDLTPIRIAVILGLADAGYSAEQIILGIALDEWALGLVPTGGPFEEELCWHLRDTNDELIRPALPAKERFTPTRACRATLGELAHGGSDATGIPTTTSATTAAAPDASTDEADNLYVGTVAVAGEVGPVYEVTASRVELELIDSSVRVMVDFTLRFAARSIDGNPVCTTTVRYVNQGQGPSAAQITVPLTPDSLEIIALEGPSCGVVEGYWATTAQADLEADWAQDEGLSLVGEFRDGMFTGSIAGLFTVTASA